MKRTILTVALVSLLALGGSAFAELCTIDAVPAATLLIPMFQVDVSDDACTNRNSLTTLFSINNASAAPQLAHVTLWTDQTIPVLDFDVYLTGYDIQTINLRDIFCEGILPQTGSAISPVGSLSDPNIAFPNCNNGVTPGGGPNYNNPFGNALIQLLKEWFTGQPSSDLGTCAGSGQSGDSVAVGYITIDNTAECSLDFPANPDYYTSGVLAYNNVLWGQYYYQDVANAFAQGFNTVSIEAAPDGFFMDGEHTFYGRYDSTLARNRREPLGTTYAARFLTGGAFDGTNVNVWREADGSSASYACNQDGPGWWPLNLANTSGVGPVIAWDESETVCEIIPDPGPSNPLPTGEISVFIPNEVNICGIGVSGACEIEVCDFAFGWLYLNLQASASVYGDNVTQNYVTTTTSASGLYSVGVDGTQLDTACTAGKVPPPVAGWIVSNPGS